MSVDLNAGPSPTSGNRRVTDVRMPVMSSGRERARWWESGSGLSSLNRLPPGRQACIPGTTRPNRHRTTPRDGAFALPSTRANRTRSICRSPSKFVASWRDGSERVLPSWPVVQGTWKSPILTLPVCVQQGFDTRQKILHRAANGICNRETGTAGDHAVRVGLPWKSSRRPAVFKRAARRATNCSGDGWRTMMGRGTLARATKYPRR